MSVRFLHTPVGILRLTARDGKLCEIALTDRVGEEESDSATDLAAEELMEYFSGKRKEFTVEVSPQGTPFQLAVWQKLAEIPFGRVATYGDIARAIGRPTACRAVANAVGRNPLLIVFPCHRVVAASGLGGFSAGIAAKRTLLRLERVKISEKSAFSEKFFFTFSANRDTI
ncbi:MAG: methylated-DNA--[Oscillospiraceae bacterium]|nr:methylated-DNA--[protein]-cysteine S-methyltransferase [Oscillospiraceae bacterium]